LRIGAAGLVCIEVGNDIHGGRGVKQETKIHGPIDVAKYALYRSPMNIVWSMHMETDLLNDVLELWACQSEAWLRPCN
jgi:hypothetical protein